MNNSFQEIIPPFSGSIFVHYWVSLLIRFFFFKLTSLLWRLSHAFFVVINPFWSNEYGRHLGQGFHAEISGWLFARKKTPTVLKIDVRKLWGYLELMSLVTLVPSEWYRLFFSHEVAANGSYFSLYKARFPSDYLSHVPLKGINLELVSG